VEYEAELGLGAVVGEKELFDPVEHVVVAGDGAEA